MKTGRPFPVTSACRQRSSVTMASRALLRAKSLRLPTVHRKDFDTNFKEATLLFTIQMDFCKLVHCVQVRMASTR